MISPLTLAWYERDERAQDGRRTKQTDWYRDRALKIKEMRARGVKVKEICKEFSLTKTTVVRISKEPV